ncbi:MAG: NAD(P)/FAD-dependent oxidoreductase, partial [Clostridiales bacterium]|nr:NAD(P)/FAD-dependent oxidoreductase [Clostridiales bacterium]
MKLNFLWIAEKPFGKKTEKAEYVRNYPAFSGTGEEFVRALEKQRAQEGITLTEKRIDGIYKEKGGFLLTSGGESFSARTVLLATGVESESTLGSEFVGRGLSYCAVCDGALYKNKRIAAVLYSDEEKEEAEYLAGFAKEVLLFSKTPVLFKASNIKVIHESPKSVSGGLRLVKIVPDKGE